MPVSQSLPIHDAAELRSEQVWSLLGRQVDALLAAWQAESPPRLADYLPAAPARARRVVLIELIKVDLEQRYARPGLRRRLEDYAEECAELGPLDALPCDLIYEEYQIRRQAGETLDPQEYFQRFPAQAPELIALLGLDAPYATTTRFGREQLEQLDVGHAIDDFELLVRLGRGAFATVFLARQKSLGRLVALKVTASRSNEPQTLAQLDHPHIVRVFDQRIVPDRKLRLLYMQYVPGGTLQSLVDGARRTPPGERTGRLVLECIDRELTNRGEVPPSDSRARQQLARASWAQAVCWLGARLASALDYAHRRGVLHRDIKPANVLLAADAAPRLVDFNISFNSKLEGVTPAAYFGGSLAYMSPEQLEACNPAHTRQPDELDGRSDVYSLGVVLWELLAGRRPFADRLHEDDRVATLEEMAQRRRRGVLPAADVPLPSDCPPELAAVLERCLAAEPSQRYEHAGQLAQQLELCLRPRTLRLIAPPRKSWRQRIQTFEGALAGLSFAGLVPNGLLSVFNIVYNEQRLVQDLGSAAKEAFYRQLLPVNGLFYGGAFLIGVAVCWPVLAALRHPEDLETWPQVRLTRLLRRTWAVGAIVALM